jgi:hypothetical protein
MDRIVMPLEAAKNVARALLPHVGTDNVTPTLTGVYFDGQFASATNRYTVGRYDLTNLLADGSTESGVWVPREALASVLTVGKTTLRWGNRLMDYVAIFETVKESGSTAYTSVEIEWRPVSGAPEVHWMRVFNANGATGNYPPVGRLIDGFQPGEQMRVGLHGDHLAKFTSLTRRENAPLRVTLSKDPVVSGRKSGGPMLIEVGSRFKGLIQPSLILNPESYGRDIAMENLETAKAATVSAPEASE